MLLESLKIFRDVVDLQSFSKAAEANFVTQSAVSQQIRNLERQWKAPLLERSSRRLELTPAGRTLYEEARTIVERYEALLHKMSHSAREITGSLRIATIHGVGLHELPPYIKRFLKLYPKVNVKLQYVRDSEVYEEVLGRRADLGIAAFPRARRQIDIIPFREDELLIVTPPSHPLGKARTASVKKLQGQNFVAFEKGIPTRRVVDEMLAKYGIRVHLVMEFDNVETVKRAVEIGAGISILPSVSVQNEVKNRTLWAVSISGKPLTRPLGVILNRSRALPLTVQKFLDVLLDRA